MSSLLETWKKMPEFSESWILNSGCGQPVCDIVIVQKYEWSGIKENLHS